jgi:hypothetical protein
LEEIKFENNIISVELAKVLRYYYLRVGDTLEQVERLNKHPKMQN